MNQTLPYKSPAPYGYGLQITDITPSITNSDSAYFVINGVRSRTMQPAVDGWEEVWENGSGNTIDFQAVTDNGQTVTFYIYNELVVNSVELYINDEKVILS